MATYAALTCSGANAEIRRREEDERGELEQELELPRDCEVDFFFIDALGDFLCAQAITTKESNSSSET